MTTVEADRELKAKHRALWASGDYPAVAAELIPSLGPELVRAAGVRARRPGFGRSRRLRQRGHPGRRRGGHRDRERPHAGAVRSRASRRRQPRRRSRVGRGGRGSTTVRRQQFRHRDVVRGRDVRPPPSGGGRRTRPRGPAGWNDWTDQLDAAGLHRSAVCDHEAVRATATARRQPSRRCGATRITFESCSGTGSPT